VPQEPSLAAILPLVNARIETVAVRDTGRLRIAFGNGYLLDVEPDERYEAWQLSPSRGFMLVCSPGGKVSLFRDHAFTDAK
jgi:Family of unknown function (DUF6188)